MAIVVETGAGLESANAYVSVDDCLSYCTLRGLTFAASPTVLGEAAIIRATAAIDAKYRGRFPGYKVNGRDQALEWPRAAAYDYEGELIDADAVPQEIINAACEAAVRELAVPNSMMPDLARGGSIKRVKAGSVEVEYAGNAEARTTFQVIDGILSGILGAGSGGGLFGKAVRG